MTGIVHVVAVNHPVRVTRNEDHGASIVLQPEQHETFTVRPGESIMVAGLAPGYAPLPSENLSDYSEQMRATLGQPRPPRR